MMDEERQDSRDEEGKGLGEMRWGSDSENGRMGMGHIPVVFQKCQLKQHRSLQIRFL